MGQRIAPASRRELPPSRGNDRGQVAMAERGSTRCIPIRGAGVDAPMFRAAFHAAFGTWSRSVLLT